MNVTGKPVYAGTIGGGTHARSVPSPPLHPYRACVVRRTWHAESSLYTHMYIYLHDGTRDTRAYTAAYRSSTCTLVFIRRSLGAVGMKRVPRPFWHERRDERGLARKRQGHNRLTVPPIRVEIHTDVYSATRAFPLNVNRLEEWCLRKRVE